MKTYYLIKYALTKGIQEVQGEEYCPAMSTLKYVVVKGMRHTSRRLGKDIFETMEEARAKSNEMRRRKIESLNAQIEKLKKMHF